jgi:uncharacterized delta-60 repeat protein
LDTTFGDVDPGNPSQRTGRARVDLGGSSLNFSSGIVEFAEDMAVQTDGKIVLAGRTDARAGTLQFGVARVNADGTLDTGFGTNGIVVTDVFGQFSRPTGVAIQADSKIVVAGTARGAGADFAIVRYDAQGNLDSTFGGDGIVGTDFIGLDDVAHRVAIQPDGKIVAVGYSNVGGHFGAALARYLPEDGGLDPTFDQDGMVTMAASYIGYHDIVPYAIVIQQDGKIVIGGNAQRTADGNSNDFVLCRFMPNGSLDTGFDADGVVTLDFAASSDAVVRLVLQSDAKIIASGSATNGASGGDFAIARFNSDGSLDDGGPSDSTAIDSFGIGGKITTDFASGFDTAAGIAQQPDGKIVAAGPITVTGQNDVGLARYENGPSPNSSPSADAGGPYSVVEGNSVVLDASNTTDPDQTANTLLYEWDLDGDGIFGESDEAASRGNETGINPTFDAARVDGPSSVTVSLRVTDNGGLSSLDTATINVSPQPPFTVITHGFQLRGESDPLPSWTLNMRAAIEARGVEEYESVVVDWQAESNNASPGWPEDVGDELFARIMWQLQHDVQDDTLPIDIHFVGHSRGTVVNSEANERLAYYEAAFPAIGYAIDEVQVTMLDAHPANNTAGASVNSGLRPSIQAALLAADTLFEFAAQDPDPEVWSNVTWADAYFQHSLALACLISRGGPGLDFFLNLHGLDFRPELYSLDLTQGLVPGGLCHGDFGDWYTETIADASLEQGYYHSLAQPGWPLRPSPQTVSGVIPSPPIRIFNGGFEYRGSRLLETDIPGWRGQNFSVQSGALRLDADQGDAANVTHNPLFVAPDMRSLEFEVTHVGPRRDATLSVYVVPVTVDVDIDPNSELVMGAPELLRSWSLSNSLSSGLVRIPLGLAESDLGHVKAVKFELVSSDRRKNARVTIDNVTLSSSDVVIGALVQERGRGTNGHSRGVATSPFVVLPPSRFQNSVASPALGTANLDAAISRLLSERNAPTQYTGAKSGVHHYLFDG